MKQVKIDKERRCVIMKAGLAQHVPILNWISLGLRLRGNACSDAYS